MVRGGRWCWTMGASVWKPPREGLAAGRGVQPWHIPALLGHLWVPSAATSQAGGFPVDPQLWRHLKILYQCTDPAMGHPRIPHQAPHCSKPNHTQNVKPSGLSSDAPSTSSHSHNLPQHLPAAHPWPRTPTGHRQGHPGLPQSVWRTYIYTDIKEIALIRGEKGETWFANKSSTGDR